MNIDKLDVRPVEESINPELRFELILKLQKRFQIPIEVMGFLFSDENKKLTNLTGFSFDPSIVFELSAANAMDSWPENFPVKLFAPLNFKVLDYLETRRVKPKGDILLKLEIIVKTLTTQTRPLNFFVAKGMSANYQMPENLKDALPILYQRNEQSPLGDNIKVLSGGDYNIPFLELKSHKFEKKVVIKSSDWIHDYCPIFQLGKFMVFEYPVLDFAQGSGSLEEYINEAAKAVRKMETSLKEGEWNQVLKESRSVMELLRKSNEIKELLKQIGYTEQAAIDLVDKSLQGLFDFSSKFHHKLDRSNKIMAEFEASKEDAYLIYALSLSIVNWVSKKMQRLQTSSSNE